MRKSLLQPSFLSTVLLLAACSSQQKANPSPDSAAELAAPRDRTPRAEGGPVVKDDAATSQATDTKTASAVAPRREMADEQAAPPHGGPAPKTKRSVAAPSVAAGSVAAAAPDFETEAYAHVEEHGFTSVLNAPLSTFSIDVDTASYSNVRRFLTAEAMPPSGAVRVEELINYFDYDYPQPTGDAPFSVTTEVGAAPWAPEHRLLHIGLQGKDIETRNLPPRNLVFLLDVSGSMDAPNKLPLLKRSFAALLSTMGERDHVSIVVYAGASGVVLPPTPASNQREILSALERLSAGGSTNGGEGIELAYRLAEQSFRKDGVNRVILATDGDFNVGTTSESELVRLIEKKRDSGVFLTVLGYGMGNYKDSTLEQLADHGNGNYAYIDSFEEAQKVLVKEGGANLVTIAQDVKIQVEMNPRWVGAYRLIGYENRRLATEDFANDKKDAGDIGAGHTVTALYELLTPEQAKKLAPDEKLRYQATAPAGGADAELCTVKLRFKKPLNATSRLESFPVSPKAPAQSSETFRFSAAVASFGMLLSHSEYKGQSTFALVNALARGALGPDASGYRREFLGLVTKAESLNGATAQLAR